MQIICTPHLSQIRFSRVPQNILDNFVKKNTFYFSSWRKQAKIINADLTLIHPNTHTQKGSALKIYKNSLHSLIKGRKIKVTYESLYLFLKI